MPPMKIALRRVLLLAIAGVLALGVLACGQGDDEASKASDDGGSKPAAGEKLKLAVVLPGKIDDGSWNQDGYEGLMDAGKSLDAETAYVENVGPSNQETALRNYGSQGFDVVFAHGGQYETAVQSVAPRFPDTQFVTISGVGPGEGNTNAYGVDFAQPYYVQGYLSAKLSKSGRIGVVTALQGLENVNQLVSGLRAGAKAADPSVKTTVVYLKNNEDPAEAKAAAQALISDGVDVLAVGALNAAQQGAIQAAREAKVWIATQYANFTKDAGEQIITSQLYTWGSMYTLAAEAHKNGELNGVSEQFGITESPDDPGTRFEYNEGQLFNPKIPKKIIAETEQVIEEVKAGKVDIEVSKEAAAPGTR
jgi:basic membrane protein A and related proteins